MTARFTPRATREVLAATVWIASDSPAAARAFREAVARMSRLLGEQRFAGTERPDIADPPIRFWPLGRFPYLAVYDPTPDPPVVLRVVHASRDLPEALGGTQPSRPFSR